MIDVHSHLIPTVDDGATTIEDTAKMLKEAEKAGFTDIILTSHYMPEYYEVEAQIVNTWTHELKSILDKENISINLYTGNEVYITEDIDKLITSNSICTLAGSRYLLMELPMSSNVKYLNNILFTLKSMQIVPVIAHPERYEYVQENPDMIRELIEQGCLIQCNYASTIGFYGSKAKKTLKLLLKKDLVHLLGSDCHKPNTIYKDMEKITKKLKKMISEEQFYRITVENPNMILKNENF